MFEIRIAIDKMSMQQYFCDKTMLYDILASQETSNNNELLSVSKHIIRDHMIKTDKQKAIQY